MRSCSNRPIHVSSKSIGFEGRRARAAYQLPAAGAAGVLAAGEGDDERDPGREPQRHPQPEPHSVAPSSSSYPAPPLPTTARFASSPNTSRRASGDSCSGRRARQPGGVCCAAEGGPADAGAGRGSGRSRPGGGSVPPLLLLIGCRGERRDEEFERNRRKKKAEKCGDRGAESVRVESETELGDLGDSPWPETVFSFLLALSPGVPVLGSRAKR